MARTPRKLFALGMTAALSIGALMTVGSCSSNPTDGPEARLLKVLDRDAKGYDAAWAQRLTTQTERVQFETWKTHWAVCWGRHWVETSSGRSRSTTRMDNEEKAQALNILQTVRRISSSDFASDPKTVERIAKSAEEACAGHLLDEAALSNPAGALELAAIAEQAGYPLPARYRSDTANHPMH